MASKSGDGRYEVVWPSGERKQKMRPLAKRLDTLNGKSVAQLWDCLFAGDEVFLALGKKLRRTPSESGDGRYAVDWPSGERKQYLRPLAKRLGTLNGKTVAQLWDYPFAGDEVFLALEEKLREQYPDIKFVSWREFGSTH